MIYIDSHSWKCLLGAQSKNISENNGIYFWQVGKRQNFCTDRQLTINDLYILSPNMNFHYLSLENFEFLKQHFKLQKHNQIGTKIDLTKFTLAGKKNRNLRHAYNRNKSSKLVVENNFRKLDDIKIMLNEWSNILAQKYFRDNSGKNFHFYKNNFHLDCHNIFIYDGDKLIAFGTASPENNGYSAYIVGKALCHQYLGLSEYADCLLYENCLANNVKTIDLGQTTGGLVFYKNKFPGAFTYNYINGKIL